MPVLLSKGGSAGPGTLRAILSVAVDRKIRPDNPVSGVLLFKNAKRERFLRSAEFSRFGAALRALQHEGMNP